MAIDEDKLSLILKGVLLNGYMQGTDCSKISFGVIKIAIKEIKKTLED